MILYDPKAYRQAMEVAESDGDRAQRLAGQLDMLLADFWTGQWPTSEVPGDEGDPIDAPPDEDPSSLYREAYYAGMADGPVPGTD